MTHRFRVGQIVELRAAPRTSNRRAGPCEVLFCLPHDRGPLLYRVRPLDEGGDRVVDEADLSPSEATKPGADTAAKPFSIAINRR